MKNALLAVFLVGVLLPAPHRLHSARPVINLEMPTVEKLGDRYRLSINDADKIPHYLVEQTNKKIWIRFSKVASEGSQVLEGDSVIREVRWNQKRSSADMVILMGPDAVANEVFYDDGKKRLVVEVLITKVPVLVDGSAKLVPAPVKKSNKTAKTKKVAKEIPVLKAKPPAAAFVADPIIFNRDRKEKRLIVIDAGHGGMDSGAIGARGTMEKDVNLEVAKELARQLRKEKNTEVILTRDKDEFIPLGTRTEIANKYKADIFVSVHCNSSLSPRNTGFEAYILSPDATDKAAAAVARIENSVVSLEVQTGQTSSRLEMMLASMLVQHHINNSSKMASLVCRAMREKSNIDTVSVKEADFFVLRGAQMPAVLLELEYLSNPLSETRLRSSRYLNKLIKGITDGVMGFARIYEQERDALAARSQKSDKKVK